MLTKEKMKSAICEFLKLPAEKLTDDAILTEVVNESFILVEMVMYLQDEFHVRIIQNDLRNVRTVGELIEVFVAKSQGNK